MFQTTINIGYARVSTQKQDLGLEVQIEASTAISSLSNVNLLQTMHVQNSKKP